MKKIVIGLRSATTASKAKRLLGMEGIKARMVKPDIDISEQGCAYAIEIGEGDFFAAAAIMRRASVEYRLIEQ